MKHSMRLLEAPFERIANGSKTIELRLFDEKRRGIKLGDTIDFAMASDLSKVVSCDVFGLLQYHTFEDLVSDFSMDYFGYPKDYSRQDFIDSIRTIYSVEEEKQYGVLGIRIKLVE